MKIKSLIAYLESIAPPVYQENYDNAGLIVGDPKAEIKGVLVCLDAVEAVVEEAIAKKCNVIIAHHPIVFKGLKKFNGKSYVERVVIKAIKNDIAIYAIHTNLDNMYFQGVNTKIAEKIGLVDTQVLAPKKTLKKLFTFVPTTHSDIVRSALFEAGAGNIGHTKQLSYSSLGVGTEGGSGGAQVKLEVLFPNDKKGAMLKALAEAYPDSHLEYDIIDVENKSSTIGSGMVGNLKKPMKEKAFLKHLKTSMKVNCIRHTALLGNEIKRVAVCGGAGGFLLSAAKGAKADIFITADYKYHEFFDADGRIIIADIGHFESEQFTIELLQEIISQKFSNFAAHCTKVNTNPIHYLC